MTEQKQSKAEEVVIERMARIIDPEAFAAFDRCVHEHEAMPSLKPEAQKIAEHNFGWAIKTAKDRARAAYSAALSSIECPDCNGAGYRSGAVECCGLYVADHRNDPVCCNSPRERRVPCDMCNGSGKLTTPPSFTSYNEGVEDAAKASRNMIDTLEESLQEGLMTDAGLTADDRMKMKAQLDALDVIKVDVDAAIRHLKRPAPDSQVKP